MKYKYSLSEEAVLFLHELSRAKRDRLMQLIKRTIELPDLLADVDGVIVDGRQCMLRVEEGWTLIYRLDFPIREVRFVGIERCV